MRREPVPSSTHSWALDQVSTVCPVLVSTVLGSVRIRVLIQFRLNSQDRFCLSRSPQPVTSPVYSQCSA